jgi:hypothetical protein
MKGLDKFRIKAIVKIIKSNRLSDNQYSAAVKALKEKCEIYADGCRKRGREEEALYYAKLADNY